MYLISYVSKEVYHLFDGKDTLCKMYSTGGLNRKNYGKSVRPPIQGTCCKNCLAKQKPTKAATIAFGKKRSSALLKVSGDFTKETLIEALTEAVRNSEYEVFYNISLYGGTNKRKKAGVVSSWEPRPTAQS